MKTTGFPQPKSTYMSKEQQAGYLQHLRSRPLGSRPSPLQRPSNNVAATAEDHNYRQIHPSTSLPSTEQALLKSACNGFVGRSLARSTPDEQAIKDAASATVTSHPSRSSGIYVERGTRWMERQETKSLRMALDDMDLVEEKRIHAAAQDEAAELVWKHRNAKEDTNAQHAPYVNPDSRPCRDYRSHLRKGSYQRSYSNFDPLPAEIEPRRADHSGDLEKTGEVEVQGPGPCPQPARSSAATANKRYGTLAQAVATDIEHARRRSSGCSMRIMSGDKRAFMNPNDRIWEDDSASILINQPITARI